MTKNTEQEQMQEEGNLTSEEIEALISSEPEAPKGDTEQSESGKPDADNLEGGEVGKGWGWDVMSETVIDQNGADAICVSVRGWFQHGGQMYSISETFGSFKRVSEVGFKQARQQAIKNAVVESFTFLGLAANERLA